MTKFQMGDRVKKKSGSEWEGIIVGTYSTELTAEGYAVESCAHANSVQIYPGTALEIAQAEQAPAQDERDAHVPDKVFQDEFQAWWEDHGQYCRAGGGDYERTFAFQAWRHLYPMLMQARAIRPAQAGQPARLQHMAYAEDGRLYWSSGRKVDNCELYAMPDFGRAPDVCVAQTEQQLVAWRYRYLRADGTSNPEGSWYDHSMSQLNHHRGRADIEIQMIYAAPIAQTEPSGYSAVDMASAAAQGFRDGQAGLRSIHAMILNALDRDAADGKVARGETAAESLPPSPLKEVSDETHWLDWPCPCR